MIVSVENSSKIYRIPDDLNGSMLPPHIFSVLRVNRLKYYLFVQYFMPGK